MSFGWVTSITDSLSLEDKYELRKTYRFRLGETEKQKKEECL